MAYILGFWFADGYMRKERSYRVVLCSNDKHILMDIRSAMSSTNPVRRSKGDDAWHVSFHSKHLYGSLTKLGGFRRKSKTITFPRVPRKYLRDFIRGYFDGDGSVFFVEYIRTKDGRPARELRTNFTSGSRKFLEELMFILKKEINLPLKALGVFNNGASLKLGYGMKDSDELLRYMYYPGFPIGLERKAIFLSRIPDYQIHKSHNSKQH
jgi:hypothetical protein